MRDKSKKKKRKKHVNLKKNKRADDRI